MSDILSIIGGQGTDDIVISGAPFLKIIQKGSPQYDETHKDHAKKGIPGCKVGDVFFANTNAVAIPRGQVGKFVPLAHSTSYAEFEKPSGNFVRNHPLSIVKSKEYRKGDGTEKGKFKEFLGKNELDLTIYIAGLLVVNGEEVKAVIPFSSTSLRAARDVMSAIARFRYETHPKALPPIFARGLNLKTKNESNDKGSWAGWDITFAEAFSLTADTEHLLRYSETAKLARADMPAVDVSSSTPAITQSDENEDGPF